MFLRLVVILEFENWPHKQIHENKAGGLSRYTFSALFLHVTCLAAFD